MPRKNMTRAEILRLIKTLTRFRNKNALKQRITQRVVINPPKERPPKRRNKTRFETKRRRLIPPAASVDTTRSILNAIFAQALRKIQDRPGADGHRNRNQPDPENVGIAATATPAQQAQMIVNSPAIAAEKRARQNASTQKQPTATPEMFRTTNPDITRVLGARLVNKARFEVPKEASTQTDKPKKTKKLINPRDLSDQKLNKLIETTQNALEIDQTKMDQIRHTLDVLNQKKKKTSDGNKKSLAETIAERQRARKRVNDAIVEKERALGSLGKELTNRGKQPMPDEDIRPPILQQNNPKQEPPEDYTFSDDEPTSFGRGKKRKFDKSMRALSNTQIHEYMKQRVGGRFKGVVPRDMIHTIRLNKNVPGSFVINTAKQNQPGEHWVACYIDPKKRELCYYDSFGDAPDTDMIDELTKKAHTLRKLKFQLKINAIKNQHANSHSCGYLCCHFLEQMHDGKQFKTCTGFDSKEEHVKSMYKDFARV